MEQKEENYQYLISLYSSVDEYLSDSAAEKNRFPEVITSFCTVTEKTLKIQLSKENPILVYDIRNSDNMLIAAAKRQELDIPTIKFDKALKRYQLLHKGSFSDEEVLALNGIYNHRNHLLHSHNPDNVIASASEDIIKKMGTVWGKISKLAVKTFGKKLIKSKEPKLKYTETQLEDVLRNEVMKKIEKRKGIDDLWEFVVRNEDYPANGKGQKCPRCGKYGFAIEGADHSNTYTYFKMTPFSYFDDSNLYKCESCHLELTKKEFEIAKRPIMNFGIVKNVLKTSI